MLDYETEIKPLEDAGKMDAEIATHFAQKTAGPIDCGAAKVVLEEDGAVVEDPITLQRSGTLVDLYNGLGGENKQRLGWFISHVFGRGDEVSSHKQPRASMVVNAMAGLPGALAATGLKIIALGGGQPYADLTAADIASLRTQWQAEQADRLRREKLEALLAEIANDYINPAISGTADATTVRAAIKAGL